MVTKQNSDAAQQRLKKELEHGKHILDLLAEKRYEIEQQIAISADPATRFALQKQLETIREEMLSVEENISELSDRIRELSNLDTEEEPSVAEALVKSADLFTPNWSVVRSEIRYVDANLAYRFADATQDANIMLGFTTLFLGSAIGFGVSIATSEKAEQKTIFGTSLAFATILTIIFLVLTIKFTKRLSGIKRELFDEKMMNRK